MKFRNYCVVVMGDTLGVVQEIEKISDSKPNILDAKGIIIATFTSFVEPSEISEWFTVNNRSFLVFDLNENNSGFNITKKDIHEGLFGFLREVNQEQLESKSLDFLSTMPSGIINGKSGFTVSDAEVVENEISEADIEQMTKSEREEMMNQLIENGIENLTEYDKKILPLLAK